MCVLYYYLVAAYNEKNYYRKYIFVLINAFAICSQLYLTYDPNCDTAATRRTFSPAALSSV